MKRRSDISDVESFLSRHERVKTDERYISGDLFGFWRITAFLGRGGSGEVSGVKGDVETTYRKGNVNKTRTATEYTASDLCHVIAKLDRFKRGAICKRIPPDGS